MRAVVFGAAALLVAGSVQAYDQGELKAIGEGRGLYLRYCVACHGTDARGEGPQAPICSRAVPDLTMLASHEGRYDRRHVQAQIRHSAGGGMPAFEVALARPAQGRSPGAAARDIWLLTRYLEYAQAPGATTARKAPVSPPSEPGPQER